MRAHYNLYDATVKFTCRESNSYEGLYDIAVEGKEIPGGAVNIFTDDPNEINHYSKGDRVKVVEIPDQNGGGSSYVLADPIGKDEREEINERMKKFFYAFDLTPDSFSIDQRRRIATTIAIGQEKSRG